MVVIKVEIAFVLLGIIINIIYNYKICKNIKYNQKQIAHFIEILVETNKIGHKLIHIAENQSTMNLKVTIDLELM